MPRSRVLHLGFIRKIHTILQKKERRKGVWILALMAICVLLETMSVGLIIPALALFTDKTIANKNPYIKIYPIFSKSGSYNDCYRRTTLPVYHLLH